MLPPGPSGDPGQGWERKHCFCDVFSSEMRKGSVFGMDTLTPGRGWRQAGSVEKGVFSPPSLGLTGLAQGRLEEENPEAQPEEGETAAALPDQDPEPR